ncbi:arginine--tRNA ligase [Wolbachia endosymbiont of Atemnus politus]|uniref:arginine--tRNA ligase n=1 Tax=Wolbachia endosymbiont of Atemnus politus TaxID=2682840 RepID=UPI001574C662|nr:arginine--tRNA ligase [Wolbachia endosymbiont of Atemnus politus]NSM57034.1 arginine--tRNA ligase [Wolbachia endosymbiont of Atemnus politus]NSX83316.1 arginine--tRNA ligase [Wolbachia endosymbiont of Atemnus politus]
MNIFKRISSLILSKLNELERRGIINTRAANFIVEPSSDRTHGDIYTNVAMVLAKHEKKNPVEIAGMLAKEFELFDEIKKVEVAGPGFINMHLKIEIWHEVLRQINELKTEFGTLNIGNNQAVNVEFVSANPTGPLHIGHARGAVFGDVLANLLKKVGYKVTKEYYINDAGAQIDTLIRSVYLRYREALGEEISIEKGLYPGEYLKPIGEGLAKKYGKDLLEKQDNQAIREYTLNYILELIREDMNLLGVSHDVFTSEYELRGKIEESIKILSDKGLVYEGYLEKPKGKESENWTPRKEMLFRSTKFGDDVDRALKKEDGSWTYFASDITYHFDKISRGFDNMIVELGSDHGGYVKRLKAVVSALSDDQAKIEVKLHNIVNFFENGKPVKMSKRSGNFLTARDVVEEVGRDITRFIMLTRKNDMVLDFDFAKVKEQSKDNPIFYVQYAHARAHSLMRNAPKELPTADSSLLKTDGELFLIKTLAKWPDVVGIAARLYEPHRITFYLLEVAEAFHGLWGYGKSDLNMRFILEDNPGLTAARMFLVQALVHVIASGLSICNIEPLEEMS